MDRGADQGGGCVFEGARAVEHGDAALGGARQGVRVIDGGDAHRLMGEGAPRGDEARLVAATIDRRPAAPPQFGRHKPPGVPIGAIDQHPRS